MNVLISGKMVQCMWSVEILHNQQ